MLRINMESNNATVIGAGACRLAPKDLYMMVQLWSIWFKIETILAIWILR